MNIFRLMLLHGLILTCGCVDARSLTHEVNDDPSVVVTPDKPELNQFEVPSMAVSATASTVATVHDLLGDGGTIIIRRDAPHSINQSGTTISLGIETEFTYSLKDDGGLFVFAKPLPVVTARVGPITVQPWLKSIKLNPDDTATATVHGSVYGDKTRTFSIKWGNDAGIAEQLLPEVWAYSIANCQPCENAKKQITAATDLKFKVVWQNSDPPAHLNLSSRPAFWWGTDTDRPSDSKNGRTLQGWHGLKHLQEQFDKTRMNPKRFQRTDGAAASNPFGDQGQIA